MASDLRAAIVASLLVSSLACAPATRSGVRPTPVDVAALEREGDAELGRGCYLCLRSAADKYEAAIAAGAPGLDPKAAGAWVLVAVRERELGLKSSDALERARRHRAPPFEELVDAYVMIASALPLLPAGTSVESRAESVKGSRELMGDSIRQMREQIAAPPAEPTPHPALRLIRDRARQASDLVSRYLDASITCAGLDRVTRVLLPGVAPTPTPSPTPAPPASSADASGLMTFRRAHCGTGSTQAVGSGLYRDAGPQNAADLRRLVETEPRFHEAHYVLGGLVFAERRLLSAENEYFAAADGIPQMAAAWSMLGAVRFSLEEYDVAVEDFQRALNIEPNQREAMLKLAQALNYAGRFEEAMAPARRLIELGAWYQSDANYWLAFSELQLGRLQDADTHVREAKRTNPMNGDTARLTGLIAYKLDEVDRAQAEFELAVSRNSADCESHLYLGMIDGRKERFDSSIASFLRARNCYGALVDGAAARKTEIESSALPDPRKAAALSRLGQRVAANERSRAAASYGAAEGETQRGAFDAALSHASDAARHAEFAARVEEIKRRIAALRARR